MYRIHPEKTVLVLGSREGWGNQEVLHMFKNHSPLCKGPSQETENVKLAEPETPGPTDLAKPQGFNAHSFPAGIWPAPSSIFVALNNSLSPSSSFSSPIFLHNLAYSRCSEKLLRQFDGGRVKDSRSCNLQGMRVITTKNVRLTDTAHTTDPKNPLAKYIQMGRVSHI